MVTVGGAVQAVDGFGGDPQGRIEPEGGVGHGNVVVDGLRHGDDVQAFLHQTQGVLLSAAAAETHQGVQMVRLVVLHDHVRHVARLSAYRHAVRFVPAGTQDSTADGEYARQVVTIQSYGPVVYQAAEAVPETDDLHSVVSKSALADPADGRIQAGAVSAGGEDSNVPIHGASNSSDRGLSFIGGRGGGLNPSHPDAYHDAL